MSLPTSASRTHRSAAKRRHAASSVAPVATGYEHSLHPCPACFSRPARATCEGGDR